MLQNYANLDMLIEHTNALSEETGVRLLYSTPACYLKALNDARMRWPNKTDDFFPYKSGKISESRPLATDGESCIYHACLIQSACDDNSAMWTKLTGPNTGALL